MDALMTPAELSAYLQKPIATLHAWRSRGEGPQALKVGKNLRYRRADVEQWLAESCSVVGESQQ